ncbi:MAG TPA: hypothetical protein VIG44_10915, partial [Thermomicrobiales bacterium]
YGLMHAALMNKEIRVHDDGLTRDVTAASEVARAVIALLQAERLTHRIYNLGAARGYTTPEIFAALNVAVPDARYRFGLPDQTTISFGISVRRGPLDMTRFERDLGFALNDDLAAHLIAYRDWLHDHPY